MFDRLRQQVRQAFGQVLVALFFSLAPSTIPDWRADPGIRTVAVLAIGEPMRSISSRR